MITIRGIPSENPDNALRKLKDDMRKALAVIPGLGLTSEQIDISCVVERLPRVGKLIATLDYLPSTPGRTHAVLNKAALSVSDLLAQFARSYMPNLRVEIDVLVAPTIKEPVGLVQITVPAKT